MAVSDLLERVEANVSGHRLLRRGEFVLAAVSGGVDSMALLHLLARLADRHEWLIAAAHFNHQLRGAEADDDERLVRDVAGGLGLKFVADRGDVRGFATQHGLSIEMAARRLRHEALARMAGELGIHKIATAHHADDQVELALLRLIHGSGAEGLAGMRWSGPSPACQRLTLIRPLLDVRKTELRAYAARHGIRFHEDATNSQLGTERNRIRNELLPFLRTNFREAIDANVLRTIEVLRCENELVRSLAEEWRGARRRRAFKSLHPAVQRRLLHAELLRLRIRPEFSLIERLRLEPDTWVSVRSDLALRRDADGQVHGRAPSDFAFDLSSRCVDLGGGAGEWEFSGVTCRWAVEGAAPDEGVPRTAGTEYFDAVRVGAPIHLRHWRPGDRFQPIGMGEAVKLQDLFVNQKIPVAQRRRLVVATTAEGTLFWVEGLRISELFKLDKGTARRLKWEWSRQPA